MSHKKASCFLVILFCLLVNLNTLALTRIISCPVDQGNQQFACLDEAVKQVKNYLGAKVYIIGYGSKKRIPCTGRRIAASFRRQLIDAIKEQNISVNESLIEARDGGYRDEARIEVYASSSGEQPPLSAKWPPDCR